MLGHNVRAVSEFHTRAYSKNAQKMSCVRLLSRALYVVVVVVVLLLLSLLLLLVLLACLLYKGSNNL